MMMKTLLDYLSLLASLSDSSRVRISPSLTGPFTFLIICLFPSPMNSTLTWINKMIRYLVKNHHIAIPEYTDPGCQSSPAP